MMVFKNFDTHDLGRIFRQCNHRYFADHIQPSPGFELRYARCQRYFGYFTFCRKSYTDWNITISERLRAHPRALLNTLVHEMIHMLAYQRYRETGQRSFLDETPVPGRAFINRTHGAFFVGEMQRLNQQFPELKVNVISHLIDHELFDHHKFSPERLLLVSIDRHHDKGMVYRLHSRAEADWQRLRETAHCLHGSETIRVLRVPGHLAEDFPQLRRDNRPRKNMRRLNLRHFTQKTAALENAPGVIVLFSD